MKKKKNYNHRTCRTESHFGIEFIYIRFPRIAFDMSIRMEAETRIYINPAFS